MLQYGGKLQGLKGAQLPAEGDLLARRRPHRRRRHVVAAQRAQADVGVVNLGTLEQHLVLADDGGRRVPGRLDQEARGVAVGRYGLGRPQVLELKLVQPRRQERLARHLDVGLAQAPQGVKGAQVGIDDIWGLAAQFSDGLEVGRLGLAKHVGVHVDEAVPAVGGNHLVVAGLALVDADHIDADVDGARAAVARHGRQRHDAVLVRDVELDGPRAVGRHVDGLPVRVPGDGGGGPGQAERLAQHVVLEKVGGEGHFGVPDEKVL